MEYIRKEGNNYNKYKVSYNPNVLRKLERDIRFATCKKVHVEFESYYMPTLTNNVYNYAYYPTGRVVQYNGEELPINRYVYDLYEDNDLTRLIDAFLQGNPSLIDFICAEKHKKSTVTDEIEREIRKMTLEIKSLVKAHTLFTAEVIAKFEFYMEQLKVLNASLELNKDKKPMSYFVKDLRNLIQLNLIESVNYGDYSKALNFHQSSGRCIGGKL